MVSEVYSRGKGIDSEIRSAAQQNKVPLTIVSFIAHNLGRGSELKRVVIESADDTLKNYLADS